jgi:hypothetical protein
MDYSQTSHSLSLEAVVSPNTFSVSLYLTYGSSGVLTLNILSTQASEHAVLRVPFLSNSSLCDCQALVPSSPVLPVTWCLQDCHGILAVFSQVPSCPRVFKSWHYLEGLEKNRIGMHTKHHTIRNAHLF